MSYELKSARWLAHDVLEQTILHGDHVIDATAGNGHDTLFLAQLVGETGHVTAFDIQADAIEGSRVLLRDNGVEERVTLVCDGHQHMDQYVKEPVKAVMFNLGWLPGGDKSVTTLWETTREAIMKALALLEPMGVCTVCVYPGHAEGTREKNELVTMLSEIKPQEYNILRQQFINAGEGAPECFVIQKQYGAR